VNEGVSVRCPAAWYAESMLSTLLTGSVGRRGEL
jgi:hypothetical protein